MTVNKWHCNNFRIWLQNTDLETLEPLYNKWLELLSDEFDNTSVKTPEYKEFEDIIELYAFKVEQLIKEKWKQ